MPNFERVFLLLKLMNFFGDFVSADKYSRSSNLLYPQKYALFKGHIIAIGKHISSGAKKSIDHISQQFSFQSRFAGLGTSITDLL
jgi:hypothetical protein